MIFLASLLASLLTSAQAEPFLQGNNGSWVIGNDLWNITIGQTYGTKLYFNGHDLIGDAVGHYVSYSQSWAL